MRVLAIDPGNEQSAFVEYVSDGRVQTFGKWRNEDLLNLDLLRYGAQAGTHMAIEMIASYGMPVGAEVFETCTWIGKFELAWGGASTRVFRKDVKLHLCGQPRAKDGNVRQALLDRWGGKTKALGTKKSPGPLYGFKADLWQALAVAVTYSDRQSQSRASSKLIASGEVSHV